MEHTVKHFGSQATSINSQNALHYTAFSESNESKQVLAKKVCVIHYDDAVKLTSGIELLKSVSREGSAGLLILLLDSDRAHGGDKGSIDD